MEKTPSASTPGSSTPSSSASTPKNLTEHFYRRELKLYQTCFGICSWNRDEDPFCLCRLERIPQVKKAVPNRQMGVPTGLQNLGNTCYMNSYIQTLFHLLPIRRTMYEWRRPPTENCSPDENHGSAEELQRLFATLQSTQERSASPRNLLRQIGIDVAQQQDAQEFGVLFLDFIDKALADKPGEEKLEFFFKGKSRSVVICRTCNAESASDVGFQDFALQIKDGVTVVDCLKEFLSKETLDDYSCEPCAKKIVADKKLELVQLPRLLSLYLLRYEYDRFNRRKKLSHAVQFPPVLDMTEFLSEEQAKEWGVSGCRYELQSILIHDGRDANCGHFRARLRVSNDGRWYTFDDEIITPYSNESGHCDDARDAYLLIYERQCDLEPIGTVPAIPPYIDLREKVSRDESQLRELQQAFGGTDVNKFHFCLKVKPKGKIMWLPKDWLANVARGLKEGTFAYPISAPVLEDNICDHGYLGSIRGLKAVDYNFATKLLQAFTVSPMPFPVDGNMFCARCRLETDEESDDE